MQALKLLQMESQRRSHLPRSPFPTTTEVHGNSIVGTILSVALLSLRRVLGYSGQLLGGFFSPSKFTNENSLFRFNKTRMCRDTLWHEVKRCYFFFFKQKTWKQAELLQGRDYARPRSPRVMKRHQGQCLGTWPLPEQGLGRWGTCLINILYTVLCLQNSRDHSCKSRQEQRRGVGQGAEGEGQGSVGKEKRKMRGRERQERE